MKIQKIICLMFMSVFLFNFSSAHARGVTTIKFKRGSYCGSYAGNFSRGRLFKLRLKRGQLFTSTNTGQGHQTDVRMTGPSGQIYGEKVSYNQINYYIPRSGYYKILVTSTSRYGSIQFCAY